MLELVLGTANTGKSEYCLKTAEKVVSSGGKVIFVVPEQFTFETQRKLLRRLGPAVFNRIEILSFTGLATEIAKVYGGLSAVSVDEGIRYILVRKALKSVQDNLKHFKRYVNSADFARQMLSVVGELKTAAVDVDALMLNCDLLEKSVFKDKLYDICLILKAYNGLLGTKFVDPFDVLERSVALLPDNTFFNGKTVIIDEFKGFTESQYLLLERIISGADDTVVSFCCDSLIVKSETELFANIKASALRLKSVASQSAVSVKETRLADSFYNSSDISRLERFFDDEDKEGEISGDITVFSLPTPKDEVDFCFKTIRRMVREEGLRFKDFVIVSRSGEPYSELVNLLARRYAVPTFVDSRISVSGLPLSSFTLCALKAALSFDTEDIVKMLKTGLTFVPDDAVLSLENYAYVWNINGNGWYNEWTQNPNGLSDFDDEFDNSELNVYRSAVVKALFGLRESLNSTAENTCKGILRLFEELGTLDALKQYIENLEQLGALDDAEYQRQGYDVLIKIFDKIVSVADGEIPATEFCDLLSSALSFETVGEIPQTEDQVIFGTADRIRTVDPKIAFVIGVNQDRFPQSPSDGGLFSSLERSALKDFGIGISNKALDDSIDENYLFYYACTLCSDRLYFTYPCRSLSGEGLMPSAILSDISKKFTLEGSAKNGGVECVSIDDIESKDAAFQLLGRYSNADSEVLSELKNYFKNDPAFFERYKCFETYSDAPLRQLSAQSVESLYSDNITLSATKIESFNTCRFMYFCRYSLGLKSLNKVDFDALTKGNIVHYCLEKFVTAHFSDIGTLTEECIETETAQLCEQYLQDKKVDKTALGERFRYMLEILKKTACYVATAINNEFRQSAYKPVACELKIGGSSGQVQSVKAKTEKGRTVGIVGSVDRVDVSDSGGVRVVDYKSSSKNFKLSDLLNGLNMQMMLYLYSIIKNGRDILKEKEPTAVLYFNTRADHSTKKRGDYIKMNGIVLSDPEVIREMEMEPKGKIIPVYLKKDGEVSKSASGVERDVFDIAFKYLDHTLSVLGSKLEMGDISASTFYDNNHYSCDWCDYRLFCRAQKSEIIKEKKSGNNDYAVAEILKEMEEK
ncbi:MAG: hypothetical protein E7525_03490 [Ruminococcaceae bacterium]|nr:hypothetical protein [Oscillospiraceae bacterium]